MFWLCSTYVSTFSTKIRYVSTVLDLCFDRAQPMFRLCSTFVSTFSTENVYASTVLDLFFDILYQNQVGLNCARPMFRLSRTTFRLSRPKSGMFWLCARLKIASRPQNFSREIALARLLKSKLKSSTSTRESRQILSQSQSGKENKRTKCFLFSILIALRRVYFLHSNSLSMTNSVQKVLGGCLVLMIPPTPPPPPPPDPVPFLPPCRRPLALTRTLILFPGSHFTVNFTQPTLLESFSACVINKNNTGLSFWFFQKGRNI